MTSEQHHRYRKLMEREINEQHKKYKKYLTKKGIIKMTNTHETEERLNIIVESNGFGNLTTYKTSLGTFVIQRMDELNYYGNPVAVITPLGYVHSLPPIQHFRRNNAKQWYTTTSYDFHETMLQFLERLEEQLNDGEILYWNN